MFRDFCQLQKPPFVAGFFTIKLLSRTNQKVQNMVQLVQ